jgi:hypothetical protein
MTVGTDNAATATATTTTASAAEMRGKRSFLRMRPSDDPLLMIDKAWRVFTLHWEVG